MKRWVLPIGAILFACLLMFAIRQPKQYNANDYGVLPGNSGEANSQNLQALIDKVSLRGGVIYIPEGEYRFCANGSQTIGDHCIKMRSNVTICGAGDQTVLLPQGESMYGLDMFYFNDYLDLGQGNYLENCRFERFVIDGAGTKCAVYTSAGKGFMLNLIRNCHWQDVTVKNTDATGFGMDCPMDCSITNCVATGCGKGAGEEDPGASGFGIGYGYCAGETMTITGCAATGNRKFGFFFEHQGRFDSEKYNLSNQGIFSVTDCEAEGNLYNFGGIRAENVTYRQCVSRSPVKETVFFDGCRNSYFNGIGSDNYDE